MTQFHSPNDHYRLSDGKFIPSVGFGTWQMPNDAHTSRAVSEAIAAGYRHIDTAQMYGNEEAVGQGIRDSGAGREEIFLTTKIGNGKHSYELAKASITESLRLLGTDYIDLVLIHWPNPREFRDHWQAANAETWRALEEFVDTGQVRSIGISNFLPHHMDELLKTARHKPVVNQIMLCPGLIDRETVAYCEARDILLEAYSPLGRGELLDAPELKRIADNHKKSPAQVALRWSLQMGFLPLPKSKTAARIVENIDLFDFRLTDAEVEELSGIETTATYLSHPDA